MNHSDSIISDNLCISVPDPEDGGGGGTTVLCCAVGIAHNPLGGSGGMPSQKILNFFNFRPSESDIGTF